MKDDGQFTPDELAYMQGKAEPEEKGATLHHSEAEDTDAPQATEDQPEATEAAAATKEVAAEATEATDEGAEATEATEAEPAKPEPILPPLPEFKPGDLKQYDATRAELKSKLSEAREKWASGEMEDKDWFALQDQVQEQIEQVIEAKATAKALEEANRQMRQQEAERSAKAEQTAMAALATRVKAQLDYAKVPGAAQQFDLVFSGLKADPGNADKSVRELVEDAHRVVLTMRGIQAPKPEAKPRPEKPAIPQTLSGLPAAANAPLTSDIEAQLAAITDPDLMEAKWASLPKSQREAMLRSSLPRR